MDKKIGFIGAGNMASAIISGLISSGTGPSALFVSDINSGKLDTLALSGVNVTQSSTDVVEHSDIIILAVKPNILPNVLGEIANSAINYKDKIFVSIAAGFTVSRMREILGHAVKSVRTMPNTPALIGKGMTVIAMDERLSADEASAVTSIFASVGEVIRMDENFINAATALHGSSPAYAYMLIDAMAKSGERYGISKETALKLSAQAVLGAAAMV